MMEIIDHTLKVAPTAAIVLLQAKPLYEKGLPAQYFSRLDFGAVQDFSAEISQLFTHFTDIILYRKRFVRYLLEHYLQDVTPVQVVILGAGLDPLSLFLLEEYGAAISGIYEVDSAHIELKSTLYNNLLPEQHLIHFIQADITDTLHLLDKLRDAGYSSEAPAIIIFEGVIHYIPDELFLNTMQVFRTPNKTNVVIMDFMLPEDQLPARTVPLFREILSKMEAYIGGRLQLYSRQQVFQLITLLQGDVAEVNSLQDIEFRLNGRNELFYEEGEGFMEMTAFYL